MLRAEIAALLPGLRRCAYSLTGRRHDADDLVQATIERLLDRGVPADADTRRWSLRVCRNLWIDEYRSRKARATETGADLERASAEIDGERLVLGRIAFSEVDRAMRGIPDDQRTALALFAVEGLSYAEIAEITEAPIGTVMSRIARARAAVASALSAPQNRDDGRGAGATKK